MPQPRKSKMIYTELEVPESTFYEWTKNKRSEMQKEINEGITKELLNPFKNQKIIAEEYNITQQTVSNLKSSILQKILAIGKICILSENDLETRETKKLVENTKEDIIKSDLDFLIELMDFRPYLYNMWNIGEGDDHNDYFGQFPIKFMNNILYYFIGPFDFVYDPFAGGATTMRACEYMFRQWYLTDLSPDPSRKDYINQWDINDGLPEIPKPNLVFLGPPYWKQAEKRYSESEKDLANMSLEDFYKSMEILIKAIIQKRVNKIALVISPTQFSNENYKFEDHIFKINEMFSKQYEIEMRILLPYSTQQYSPAHIGIMKAERKPLTIIRDLVIWKRNNGE